MPIFVTTGGPVSNSPSMTEPQIQNAVFTAIRFCEREPLYFNESCAVVFATAAGRAWYDSGDEPNIATLAGVGKVYCEDAHGRQTLLQHAAPHALEILAGRSAGRGRPQYYTYFAQKLRLHPAPDADSYRIRLHLSPMRLHRAGSADEAHPWFREAFDLIKARAKYELYKDILKDAPMAMAAFADFNEQLAALRVETSRRNGTGYIRATGF